MFLGCVISSLYFRLLVLFSFVSHPVGYCFLLIRSSLCASSFLYISLGFSWYLALFILVYVGGVYVLFVFISLYTPNSFSSLGGSFGLFTFIYFILFSILFFWNISIFQVFDTSHYLCSYMEGFSYLLLCFSLLVGLVGVRVVSSRKDSFFR